MEDIKNMAIPAPVSSRYEYDKALAENKKKYIASGELPEDSVLFKPTNAPKELSVTQWKNQSQVIEDNRVVNEYLSSKSDLVDNLLSFGSNWDNEDPAEAMRDRTYRLGNTFAESSVLEDADDDIKERMARLKTGFEAASIKGGDEWWSAIGDIGTDLLTSPEVLIGMALSVATGGAAPAAIAGATAAQGSKSVVAYAAAKNIAAQTVKRGASATSLNSRVGFPLVTGAWGAADSLIQQDFDKSIGLREEFSVGETLVGFGAGAVFGKALQTVATPFMRNAAIKSLETSASPRVFSKQLDDLVSDPVFSKALDEVEVDLPPIKEGMYDSDVMNADIEGSALDYLKKVTVVAEELTKEMDNTTNVIAGVIKSSMAKGGRVSAEDVRSLKEIRDYVAKNGGGEETLHQLTDTVVNAAQEAGGLSQGEVGNILRRYGSRSTSQIFWGKQAGFLTPFVKASPTAKKLQTILAPEFAKVWKGQQDYIPPSLFETYKAYSGEWLTKYMSIVEPLAKEGIRNKTAGKLDANMNLLIHEAMRGKPTKSREANIIGMNLRGLYSEIGDKLLANGLINKKIPNYVHRMWHRDHILAKQDEFKGLLVSEGQAADLLEADDILKGMLDKRNQLDGAEAQSNFFTKKRVFNDIEDESKFVEFFEQDIRKTMDSYIHQASKAVAKKERLGVSNIKEFREQIINPIISEVRDSAGDKLGLKEYQALHNQLELLYKSVTSEGQERFGPTAEGATNFYGLATRMSLLGAAAVTSLTEIMLNLPKAGFRNSIKGFAAASENGFKMMTGDMTGKLRNNFGLTAKEAKRELFENGLAMEHGLMSVTNRLAGDEMSSEWMNKASNQFFRLTLLDHWTQFVQSTSFVTGKNLITQNLAALAAHGDAAPTKRITQKINELKELNVDIDAGVTWYRKGQNLEDPFYGQVKKGAARYTNDVILQPTAMSAQKPALYNNPKYAFLFQLSTYPTVFSNTILKGAAKKLTRDTSPEVAARYVATGILMTEMQRVLNDYRSEGKSEEEGWGMSTQKAVERWGGFSMVGDQYRRAVSSSKFVGNASPYLGIPFGVFPSDVITVINQGPVTFAGQRLFPGYTIPFLIDQEGRKDYRKKLREIDKKLRPDNDYGKKSK